jgi:hypothetical protein
VSGQAVVSRKGLPKGEWLKIPVADDAGWEKVEKCIRMWMEQLKKEIKVKWTVVYKKKPSTAGVPLADGDGNSTKVFIVKVILILGAQRTYRKAALQSKTTRDCG